jgi:hypothetical protein
MLAGISSGSLKELTRLPLRFSHALAHDESELNDRVYRLLNPTPEGVKLLQKEAEH